MALDADVVICGAGIAGVSAAYHLGAGHGLRVALVDERPPLSLTSDASTECYRNWWPGPDDAMVGLMNRSIDLMEGLARETGNTFHLNRRGYLYATAEPEGVEGLTRTAETASRQGAGPLRSHTGEAAPGYVGHHAEGFAGQPDGADLLLNPTLLRDRFPCLSPHARAALHVRRAGWLSAQQLGVCLLERARQGGTALVRGRVVDVELRGGRVDTVVVRGPAGEERIHASAYVLAAGPMLHEAAAQLGVDLPVTCELHARAVFRDPAGALPRSAPLLIWTDPQALHWTEDEREALATEPGCGWLLGTLPGGVHCRPEGGAGSDRILALWAYHTPPAAPTWPPEIDPLYAEVTLRGMATMVPGLRALVERGGRPAVDGGYYTRTADNRPLVGPLAVPGAYVLGALSGFGIMAACGAGELLAAHVAGSPLPAYAAAFTVDRLAAPLGGQGEAAL